MIGVALAACTAASIAFAGKYNAESTVFYQVITGANLTYFQGSPWAARRTSDGYQDIGCTTVAASNTAPYASCWAEDARGNYVGCITYDPNFIAAAGRINLMSTIIVQYVTSTGTCNEILVGNSAGDIP
jgi:hypothetical protein